RGGEKERRGEFPAGAAGDGGGDPGGGGADRRIGVLSDADAQRLGLGTIQSRRIAVAETKSRGFGRQRTKARGVREISGIGTPGGWAANHRSVFALGTGKVLAAQRSFV